MQSIQNPQKNSLELFAAGSFYSDQEIAAATGTARGTWQNMRSRGRGPRYFKLGRTVRYVGADLNRYFHAVDPSEEDAT